MLKLTKKRITNKRKRNISSIRRKRMASRRKRQVGGEFIILPNTIAFCVYPYHTKIGGVEREASNTCNISIDECSKDAKFTATLKHGYDFAQNTNEKLFDLLETSYNFKLNKKFSTDLCEYFPLSCADLRSKYKEVPLSEANLSINEIRSLMIKYHYRQSGCNDDKCGMLQYIGICERNETSERKQKYSIGWVDIYNRNNIYAMNEENKFDQNQIILICLTLGIYTNLITYITDYTNSLIAAKRTEIAELIKSVDTDKTAQTLANVLTKLRYDPLIRKKEQQIKDKQNTCILNTENSWDNAKEGECVLTTPL